MYKKAKLEINLFEVEDIITTSGATTDPTSNTDPTPPTLPSAIDPEPVTPPPAP